MKITNASRSFAETTTFHGLSELFLTTNKFMRVIWGVIMLISIALCSWQLYQTITEFQSQPTAMRTLIKQLDEYPTVYFTVYNTIDYNKLQQYGLDRPHGWYILDHFPAGRVEVTEWTSLASDPKQIKKIQADTQRVQDENGWDFEDLVMAVANSPESILPVNKEVVNSSIVINEWGINYAFATGVEVNGGLNGYSMNILVSKKAIGGQLNCDRENFRAYQGVFLSVGSNVHNHAQKYLMEWKAYHIIVTPHVTRSLSTQRRPCSNEYESAIECRWSCIAKNQACGKDCEWFLGQKGNHSQRFCINAIDRGNQNRSCMSDCKALCPPSCNLWSYNIEITLGLGSDKDPADVYIYLNSMEVMVSEEYYSYSSSTLFSNVGGILSLYLGASVLSFMHLAYFFFFKARKGTNDPEKA